eukprot:CAMPEP_0198308708 /NCGR_PEP_ID=MMETSP1450-20131203/1299_1 /TAXON_ID=753684 ORGANISM="Madagascaria erythrocladiodes, Strain CCMP3234" /NCGR_SAMPLE_ID=MMETSP1450 /ASSEMBLY_ACC=CAM_ASM_001115 /LENGTH=232 /DNA_ID=CAMNT_0044011411 /DNA_START=91 /DNA_END=789 /DNA_ORIENTATION=-
MVYARRHLVLALAALTVAAAAARPALTKTGVFRAAEECEAAGSGSSRYVARSDASAVCERRGRFRARLRDQVDLEVRQLRLSDGEAAAWFDYCDNVAPGFQDAVTGVHYRCSTPEAEYQMNRLLFTLRKWSDIQPSCRDVADRDFGVTLQNEPTTFSVANTFNSSAITLFSINPNGGEKEELTIPSGDTANIDSFITGIWVIRTAGSSECIDALRVGRHNQHFEYNEFFTLM